MSPRMDFGSFASDVAVESVEPRAGVVGLRETVCGAGVLQLRLSRCVASVRDPVGLEHSLHSSANRT